MRRSAVLLAFAATAACAQAPSPNTPAVDAAISLAAAETAFAAHSVREDMRAAFMAAFAGDGVFVRASGWAVSNDWLRDKPAPPIVLDWRPQYVQVARAGDLGISTGPWKITSRKDPAAQPAYGQFVSIWRRDAAGAWKVAVDLGIGHPQPSLWKEPLSATTVGLVAAASIDDVAGAEAAFARLMLEHGAAAAYGQYGEEDLRLYRDGTAPAASRAAALASPAMAEKWIWIVERTETSASNDFAYARGRYAAASAPEVTRGYFMRAWRRAPGGLRILMDVTNPAGES